MPAFTTETLLRTKFQLTNTTDFPTALLNDAIAQAHEALTPHLDPALPLDPTPAALITGETLLAAAALLRALATHEAATQRTTTIGGQRSDTAARHAQLLHSAALTEADAWHTLAPFLTQPPVQPTLLTTDTTPILTPLY